MQVAKQVQRDARQLFRLCRVDGLLDQARARQVIGRLGESNHRHSLALLSAFQRWLRLDQEQHTAEVQSATPLPADLQSTVRFRIEKVYGPAVSIRFTDSPQLIGGLRVKIGSDVYDGSIRSELEALEKRF
jgi:F-type H+-transporting ATPase subunit delta